MKYCSLLLIIAILGCSAPSEGEKNSAQTKGQEEVHEHPSEAPPMVLLNNGERWQANQETTTHIYRMVSYMDEFKKYKANTEYVDSCHNAGIFLKQQFDSIFIECTMKGEAHDQLHNYLMPMIKPLKTAQAAQLDESYTALMYLSLCQY